MGTLNYFRHYLPGYMHHSCILQQLLKTSVKFKWTSVHQDALEKIKLSLKNVPVMAYPDQSPTAGSMILTTDGSKLAAAGFLSQESSDGKTEVLLGCFGRSLRPNERNWPIGEIEIMGVIIALQKYRHLLIGRKVKIRSDSKMVRYLQKLKISPSSRHCRWINKLGALIDAETTTFEFISGKSNILADYLSRRSYPRGDEITDEERDLLDDELISTLSMFSESFADILDEYVDNKESFFQNYFQEESKTNEGSLARRFKACDKLAERKLQKQERLFINNTATNDHQEFQPEPSLCLTIEYESSIGDQKSEWQNNQFVSPLFFQNSLSTYEAVKDKQIWRKLHDADPIDPGDQNQDQNDLFDLSLFFETDQINIATKRTDEIISSAPLNGNETGSAEATVSSETETTPKLMNDSDAEVINMVNLYFYH